MRDNALAISKGFISDPAVKDTSSPFVPLSDRSSNIGLEIAASADKMALSSPEAVPTPNTALPLCCIIVFTSAKSILMDPFFIIKALMADTPSCKVLLTRSSHSFIGVFSLITLKIF